MVFMSSFLVREARPLPPLQQHPAPHLVFPMPGSICLPSGHIPPAWRENRATGLAGFGENESKSGTLVLGWVGSGPQAAWDTVGPPTPYCGGPAAPSLPAEKPGGSIGRW